MSSHRYEDAIAGVRPELEALPQSEPVEPARGAELAEMASCWVALCLSALGEDSEESGELAATRCPAPPTRWT